MSLELPQLSHQRHLSTFSYLSQQNSTSQDNSPMSYSSNSHFNRRIKRNKESLLISMLKSKKSALFKNLVSNDFPVPSVKRHQSVPSKKS